MEILTAEKAREISESPYISVLSKIEQMAKQGKTSWNYKYYAMEGIEPELKRFLEEIGYKVEEKTSGHLDRFDNVDAIEYTVTIKW
jgi:hypothetical protein